MYTYISMALKERMAEISWLTGHGSLLLKVTGLLTLAPLYNKPVAGNIISRLSKEGEVLTVSQQLSPFVGFRLKDLIQISKKTSQSPNESHGPPSKSSSVGFWYLTSRTCKV